jgi:photosystem II stability/assembly factor-like uncharacterized protein
MSDYRERLEQERRRFAMSGDSFQDLERRRDRKRRNRRLGSGLVALAIAAAGIGAGLYAFRPTEQATPVDTPTASVEPTITSPGPTSTETPSPTPPVTVAVAAPSGPIQFIDDEHGWMVDSEGQILASTDGGATWEVQLSGPSNITAVAMLPDGQHGWGVGQSGLIHTSDGGVQWVTWGNQALSSIQFLTPEVGWAVEATDQPASGLMTTEDGGRTWTPAPQPLAVNSVCFADGTRGWAAGPSEGGISLFTTEDGGSTWNETGIGLESGDTVGYHATVRCGDDAAWILATGDAGAGHIAYAVFRTSDGGADPVLQDAFTHPLGQGNGVPEASNPQPGPFVGLDGTQGRVVTWCPPCGGAGMPYVSLERTDDGGVTWTDPTVVDANNPAEPLGISFLDSDNGWVLLHDQESGSVIVLRTTDGGQTWEQM